MRMSTSLSIGLGLVAAIALTACSNGDGGVSAGDGSKHAPDFQPGQGQAANGTAAYAPGPYGISKGSIIANYEFIGFANAKAFNGGMQAIQLADFYNPHANDPSYVPAEGQPDDRFFAPGSQYNTKDANGNEVLAKKPKALLIDVASVWCGPCNEEAGSVLPAKYAAYKPRGGEFLLQLADGPTPGTPAQPKNLTSWTTKYKVDYPATIDPSYKLGALFEADAFPANFIIDTTTMTIVEVIAGVPNSVFWAKYEKLLDPAQ